MNLSKLLYSFFTALIAIFFILVGLVCLSMPWFSIVRTHIILFIIENTVAISLFGAIFLTLGIFLVIHVILSAKHRYYRVRSNGAPILVDETLIQQLLDSYWKTLFPNRDVPNSLLIKNNQLHITADFPYFPLSEQKNLLLRIEQDLSQAFARTLGYTHEFYLSASFKDQEV